MTEAMQYSELDFETRAHQAISEGHSLLQPTYVELAKKSGYVITGAKSFTRCITSYKAADLAGMNIRPPRFIIQGLLPIGLTVLAAPPKFGKSWLVLDLCCAVASGENFWGLPTEKGCVLYIDLEGREWRTNERLKAMKRDAPEGLFITHNTAGLDEGLLSQIREFIGHEPNIRLIVIDTVGRVKGGARRGENSYESDSRIYAPLQRFATERELAIIAVTHLRKSSTAQSDDPFEAITGSMGLMGVADTAWMLRGKRSDEEKTFLATGRDINPVENLVSFNKTLCRWELLGDSDALKEARALTVYETSPLIRTVRKLVQEGGGGLRIKMSDLYVEIANLTGEYPANSPAALGKLVKSYAPTLKRRDSILYIPSNNGGAGGRVHEFKLVGDKAAELPLLLLHELSTP